ncbi:MAG TPA: preprotein translocase subunit SecA [Chloroflexota bacterium]|nr:preprotein translocase subunit SecA [Chloroflexota bacterium]
MLGLLARLVGGSSDREIRKLQPLVEKVNALEGEFERLFDDDLREKTAAFRRRLGIADPQLGGTRGPARVETLDDLLPEAFAAVREASRRTIGLRHFDVQLLGGIVLHQGRIAEMRTGEGKTLVASLPLYLNALMGLGVHLVTPNDYLARVGGGWIGPVYHRLGLTTSVIIPDFSGIYDPDYVDTYDHGDDRLMHWRPVSRKEAYAADVMYGTNHEFAFDYLRDNSSAYDLSQVVQRELNYAIVDEVDSILIDEARTPHIISGPAEEPPDTYYKFAQYVAQLREEEHYTVDHKMKSVVLTDEGIDRVERLAGVDNIYGEHNFHLVHYLEQALKAHVIFRRDRDYVLVADGRVLGPNERDPQADVVIVDEFTGRLMFGRRYSEGLHQALEAKEGVRIQRENITVATITLQNFFRMYKKLAGMTGTAMTEAEEFRKIYNLDVTPIPTHRPMVRQDYPDLVYKHTEAKYDAIVDEIEELHEQGRPILVGTTSVEKSEILHEMLTRRGIPHEVLNAKYHEREAAIVAQAGRKGAVTIATNMAGRGTDIILGGNPPIQEEGDEVRQLGGLHIIGTERHESRRIDNQLRGRAGRQGDPGSSRFYLALDDDLMKRFGSDRIAGLMDRLGLEDDQPIEHPLVSRSIEAAQQKVEGYNFDIRKHTVEFDDVMNRQRAVIYGERRKILEADDVKPIVLGFIRDQVTRLVEQHTDSPRPDEWDVDGLFAAVENMLGPEMRHEPEELDGLGREELVETVYGWAEAIYAAKEARYSPELMQYAAKGTLLRTIDGLWMNHLTTIDDMNAGIGLRAYGQRDPLTEYKTEAYRLFQALMADIQANVANLILRVEFVQEMAEPPPAIQNMTTNQPDAEPAPPARRNGRQNGRPAPTGPPDGQAAGSGQPLTRAERNRQAEQAKKQRQRELKRRRG